MVEQTMPYLPTILKEVIEKVNVVTSAYPLEADQFTCGFNHGLMAQVSRDLYPVEADARPDVLFWLVMNYEESRGVDFTVFADITATVLIVVKTENTYTQIERDNASFIPKLLPAYDEFIKQLNKHSGIQSIPGNKRIHKRTLRPYWGGGDVNGQDTDNLFKQKVDAIQISGLKLKLKQYKNCP